MNKHLSLRLGSTMLAISAMLCANAFTFDQSPAFKLANKSDEKLIVRESQVITPSANAPSATLGRVESTVRRAPAASRATAEDVTGYYVETSVIYGSGGSYYKSSSQITEAESDKGNVLISHLGGTKLTDAYATVSGSTISIPAFQGCPVSNGSTSMMAWVGPVNFQQSTVSTTDPIKGTIAEDGTITFGSWAIFIIESGKVTIVDAFESTVMNRANATLTATEFTGTVSTWGVIVKQPYKNRLEIENMANSGSTAGMELYPDGRVVMNPAYMGTVQSVGEIDLFPANNSGVCLDQPMEITGTANELTLGPWGVYAALKQTSYLVRYAKSTINCTEAINYPAKQSPASGSGSDSDPYIISDASQWVWLSQEVAAGNDLKDKFVKLGADIDWASAEWYFAPVGGFDATNPAESDSYYQTTSIPAGKPFAGNLDGANHKLLNILYDAGRSAMVAPVKYLAHTGTISNLTVDNAVMSNNALGIGGIVGANYGVVQNCTAEDVQLSAMGAHVGGIAALNRCQIKDCTADGVQLMSLGNIGGIVGSSTGSISNCSATGSCFLVNLISSRWTGLGGIAGSSLGYCAMRDYDIPYSIDGCVSSMALVAMNNEAVIGGIAGEFNGATAPTPASITNCVSLSSLRTSAAATDTKTYVGGIVGNGSSLTLKGCLASGMITALNGVEKIGALGGTLSGTVSESIITTQIRLSSGEANAKYAICSNATQALIEGMTNVYVDKQITGMDYTDFGFTGSKSTSYLTSESLSGGLDSTLWTITSGLYPSLKALEGNKGMQVAAAPLTLAEGQTYLSASTDFTVSTLNDLQWNVLTEEGSLTTESKGLTIEGGKVIVKNDYSRNILSASIKGTDYSKELVLNTIPSSMFEGSGTADSPYLLKSVDDLRNIARAMEEEEYTFKGYYFKLANDIDCKSDTTFHGMSNSVAFSEPIMFAGVLDGDGHVIDNYVVNHVVYNEDGVALQNSSGRGVGLFGGLAAGGEIRNLIMGPGCNVQGFSLVGGIVGINEGTIANCEVRGRTYGAFTYTGGIAGYSQIATASITNCVVTGETISHNGTLGGIVGKTLGPVTGCVNSGHVYAEVSGTKIGGIVGISEKATISNCVNLGLVEGANEMGGIVGNSTGATKLTGNIHAGACTASTVGGSSGGVMGSFTGSPTFTNNVYNSQFNTTLAVNGAAKDGVTAANIATLTSGAAFEGLNAELYDLKEGKYPVPVAMASNASVAAARMIVLKLADNENRLDVRADATLSDPEAITWTLAEKSPCYAIDGGTLKVVSTESEDMIEDKVIGTTAGVSVMFPIRTVPSPFPGEGTEASPYLISSKADWSKLADWVDNKAVTFDNQVFKLTTDLDYTDDTASFATVAERGTFGGIFDGADHTIKNLNLVEITGQGHLLSLFGYVGATGGVKNLTLEGGRFASSSTTGRFYAAGFVNTLYGTIDNCVNRNAIDNLDGNFAAGIAYTAKTGSSITNCKNYGTIMAYSGYASGIVYTLEENAKVSDCENYGLIYGSYGAGISAKSQGIIENCVNRGTMQGTNVSYIGGIVSTANAGAQIRNCKNYAEFALGGNSYRLGGIVSTLNNSSGTAVVIEDCENYSDITSAYTYSNYLGGIVGYSTGNAHAIKNCKNFGDITGKGDYIGGILGYSLASTAAKGRAQITNCSNSGDISSAKNYVGGLAGQLANFWDVTDCINTGDITVEGTTASICRAGGLAGKGSGKFTRCFNLGDITSTGYLVGGLIGDGDNNCSLTECGNTGNVTSTTTYNTTASNTAAAGIWAGGNGGNITDCFSLGNVTGPNHVAGAVGAFTSSSVAGTITRTYCAGEVKGTKDGAANVYPFAGATIGSKFTFADNYYDSTLCTLDNNKEAVATGKTTSEMVDLKLGDAWVNVINTYPTLNCQASNGAINYYAACLILDPADSFDNVSHDIRIGVPEGVTWTCSSELSIDTAEGLVKILSKTAPGEHATLTKTAGELSHEYELVITDSTSGIDSVMTDAHGEVLKSQWYTITGIELTNPADGEVVIERTLYSDGTTTVTKKIYKK